MPGEACDLAVSSRHTCPLQARSTVPGQFTQTWVALWGSGDMDPFSSWKRILPALCCHLNFRCPHPTPNSQRETEVLVSQQRSCTFSMQFKELQLFWTASHKHHSSDAPINGWDPRFQRPCFTEISVQTWRSESPATPGVSSVCKHLQLITTVTMIISTVLGNGPRAPRMLNGCSTSELSS